MIIVVDLDKTLLKVDSFPAWYFHTLKHAAFSNPLLFIHLLFLALLRATGMDDHTSFKYKLMKLLDKNDWHEIFAQKMARQIRPELMDRLVSYKDEATFILSTAAPNHYVQHLTQYFPIQFDDVFTSHIINNKLIDNTGEMKVTAFRQRYPSAVCDLFITDHHSDLPMMKFCNKVILVAPSKTTIDMVNKHKINVETL